MRLFTRACMALLCLLAYSTADAYVTVPSTDADGTFNLTLTRPSNPPYGARQWQVQRRLGSGSWMYIGTFGSTSSQSTVHTQSVTVPEAGTYQFRARLYNARYCVHQNSCSARYTDYGSADTIVVKPVFPIKVSTSAVPGAMPYQTGVSAHGQAQVSVPISVPDGVGIQPALSLSYSSGRTRDIKEKNLPSDIVGAGWSLNGLSKIHRCQVGSTRSVALNTTDQFCLDGQRLIPFNTTASDYISARFYRLEDESSQILVEKIGHPNPATFRVSLPNGNTRTYGGGNASSDQFAGRSYSPVYTWHIASENDVFGNSIKYSYERNRSPGVGVSYPTAIEYGNRDSGVYDTKIEFKYASLNNREGVQVSNVVNSRQPVILHTLAMYRDRAKIREYRLIGDDNTFGWERLKQVQVCGYQLGQPSCLRELNFNWQLAGADNDQTTKELLTSVTDSLGKITRFTYGLNKANANVSNEGALTNSTSPFGALYPNQPGTTEKTDVYVVRTLSEDSGIYNQPRVTEYGYLCDALNSTVKRGFLGFCGTMVRNTHTGVTTYTRYGFDVLGLRAMESVTYDKSYTDSSKKLLSRTYFELGHTTFAQGPWRRYLRYNPSVTTLSYEAGHLLGYQQNKTRFTVDNTYQLITSTTTEGLSSTSATVTTSGSQSVYRLTNTSRQSVNTVSFLNRVNLNSTSNRWVVGFQRASSAKLYKGNTLERSGSTSATAYTHNGHYTLLPHTVTGNPGDARYEVITQFAYDSKGNTTSETVLSNGSQARLATRTTRYRDYLDNRYPQTLENAKGHITNLTYDRFHGFTTQVTDPNGNTQRTSYNALGQPINQTSHTGVTTRYRYEYTRGLRINGILAPYKLIVESDIAPAQETYFDVLNRPVRQGGEAFNGHYVYTDVKFDRLGRATHTSLPHGQHDTPVFHETQYDHLGRVRLTRAANGHTVTRGYHPDPANFRTRIDTSETIKRSNGSQYQVQLDRGYYNQFGELEHAREAVGTANDVYSNYTYTADGQLESVTVNDNIAAMTTFTYDKLGYRTEIDGPNVGTQKTIYTALGQVYQTIDNKNQTTTFTYDVLGRMIQRHSREGSANWVYDTAPNGIGLLQRQTQSGFNQTFSYDGYSRPSIINTAISGRPNYSQSFNYAGYGDGRLNRVTHPSGQRVDYRYNSYGYVTSLHNSSGTALKTITATNLFGHVTGERYSNGVSTTRTYDPLSGFLTKISTTGRTTVQNQDTLWFSNGNLERRIDRIGTTKDERFTYDYLNRLTDADTYLNGTLRRRLDTRYDDYGRITSKTTNSDSTNTDVTGYVYNQSSRNAGFHAVSQVQLDGVNATMQYDNNGHITRYDISGKESKYIKWNALNQATEILIGNSATDSTPTARSRFKYGPSGERYYHQAYWRDKQGRYQTQTTYYVGGYEDVVTAAEDSSYSRIQKVNVDSNVRLTTTTSRGGSTAQHLHYLHRDHLGSIEKITDKNGYVLTGSHQAFDPFGERKNTDWTGGLTTAQEEALLNKQGLISARGFTDHEHLDRLGLIHMNGRIYDPQLGRFLSPDPLVVGVTSQYWNRYSYVMNNPMRFNDPSGYAPNNAGCSTDVCGNTDATQQLREGFESSQTEEVIVIGEAPSGPSGPVTIRFVGGTGVFASGNSYNIGAYDLWSLDTIIQFNMDVAMSQINKMAQKFVEKNVSSQVNNPIAPGDPNGWGRTAKFIAGRAGAGVSAGAMSIAEDLNVVAPSEQRISETIENVTGVEVDQKSVRSANGLLKAGSGTTGIGAGAVIMGAAGTASTYAGVGIVFLSGYALGSGINNLTDNSISETVSNGLCYMSSSC